MNMITGMAMLVLAAVLFFKYRPKSENSRLLCAVTALMSVLVMYAGAGSWKFQLIQLALQAVVGFCCFAQLRREKILRERRSARRHVHRVAPAAQQEARNCA